MALGKDFCYYIFKVGEEDYKPDKSKLIWNVIEEDNGKIIVVNVFECSRSFSNGLYETKKKYSNDFTQFAKEVKGWLQYSYWSKAEHEVIVSNWGGKDCECKIDVYTQVMLNWDQFIEYVWNNKHLIKKH